MTVAELLSRTSSAEITEWQAFFSLQEEERETALVEDKLRNSFKRT